MKDITLKTKIRSVGLLINIIAIIVLCAILIGSTFAWFTDSAVSSGNKIQAGSLKIDLELLDRDGAWTSIKANNAPIFDYDKWEPGYTDVKILKIENEGTLSLKWQAKIVSSGSLSPLADVIDVYVLASDTELTYPENRDLEGYTYAGTLAEFISSFESTTNGVLAGGGVSYLGIALKMRANAGNEYQGLDLGGSLDVVIYATQFSSEDDAIGSDYDANATYPVVVCDPQALKDAMLERGAYIKLETDIVVNGDTPTQWGSYMFVANGREVTIDLNGHDIVFDETAPQKVLYMFTTANGGTLNVVGDGSLVVKNGMTGIFWGMNPNDQINIYGGVFISNSVEGNIKNSSHLMYVNRGKIDVYGGKFYYPSGEWCANADDSQGNRLGIVFHEGTLLQQASFQRGDATRIQLAENCELVEVEIDGETWYKVVAVN